MSAGTGYLYARGTDNAIYQKSYNGTQWSNWETLGGTFTSGPSAGSLSPGTLHVQARGADNAVWQKSWSGTEWSAWQNLGGSIVTAGGLVFYGDNTDGALIAIDAKTAQRLWQFKTEQAWKSSPMTYAIDGEQYVAILAGCGRVPGNAVAEVDGTAIEKDTYEHWLNVAAKSNGPDAKPPVCRILDYSKYKYEQTQKQKAARKHQQQITIREIKFRPKIAEQDYATKKRHVERFLRHKDKVKITIMFRGREVTHPERGQQILDRLAEELTDLAVIEQRPNLDGLLKVDTLSRFSALYTTGLAFMLISGPLLVSRRVASPVFTLAARAVRRSTKASYWDACTNATEQAVHFCPCMLKAERATPSTATSRSALALTYAAFLPPISARTGRM